MDLSLTKLPWYAQIGAFVVLALAGVGAFYYYYEAPMREDIAARQTQLMALRADIAKGYATAKRLSTFRSEVAALESRLDTLNAVLPSEKDAADLLRRLQTVAVQSNLTIKGFKPSPPINKPLHAEWPIALELDGTYHNLATFFDRVGKFTRIINISALDVKAKDKPEPGSTITASCIATTFVLANKKVGPAAAPAKAGSPAGRGA
ncbi:MAG: type 4a pilus biogenesis protein PilO [Acidobacteriota bacterium]